MLTMKWKNDTIHLELDMCNETLIASRTLHNFMVQFEKTKSELLDSIRKFKDELQLHLNFKQKIKHSGIIFH